MTLDITGKDKSIVNQVAAKAAVELCIADKIEPKEITEWIEKLAKKMNGE